MKGAENIDIIEQCFHSDLLGDKYRQSFINSISIKIFIEHRTEEDALVMFFWKSAQLEPPVSNREHLYYRTLCRMFYGCGDIKIDSMEKVFEVLGIPGEKLHRPCKELIKEAKKAFWQQYNELTHDLKSFSKNAREIVIKRKALNYLSDYLS